VKRKRTFTLKATKTHRKGRKTRLSRTTTHRGIHKVAKKERKWLEVHGEVNGLWVTGKKGRGGGWGLELNKRTKGETVCT